MTPVTKRSFLQTFLRCCAMLLSFLLTIYIARCYALYFSNSDVVELTSSNFDTLVTNSNEVWLVLFYTPWCTQCQHAEPTYKNVARVLKGVVKVAAIDAERNKEISSKFWVKTLPTLHIFGMNKYKPTEYKYEKTEEALAEAALSAAKDMINARLDGKLKGSEEDVVELTDKNFNELVLLSDDIWLVQFFVRWSWKCEKLEQHWIKAATKLKGTVKMGALDVTDHPATPAMYVVQNYPTIKYFPAGPKNGDFAQDYDGGQDDDGLPNADNIVEWAIQKLTENVKLPKLQQIINKELFKDACENKLLCIISFLPHILDCQSECRNAYLDTLKKVAEKHKRKLWGWGWVEAGAQPDFEKVLDVAGLGYPAMAVVNLKKLKYSILRGAFSTKGIEEFLRDVDYDCSNSDYLKESPKIVEGELWDGKDGEMPIEEDIDLSDVDLDERDEL